MSAKMYAQWGGIILLVLGVVGLFTGNTLVGLNSEILEDIIHIVVGGILVYAGFMATAQAAMWAKVFGVILLVVGVLGFFNPTILGLFKQGMHSVDNIVHVIYGVVGVWAGWSKQPA